MKKRYINIFSLITAINIFLVLHIESSGNIRDGIEQNHIRQFSWWDIVLLVCIYLGAYFVTLWFTERGKPFLQYKFEHYCLGGKRWSERRLFMGSFILIFMIWFFFFLVMYPGTAMNDTIYLLENPEKLCNQHPVLYILYTYCFYRIGVVLGNPNFGLALLSLVQMLAMDYVVSYAIMVLYRKSVAVWFCSLLSCYFSFAPLFSTYAVSAIKDTPFSIALFYLVILLWELADSKGEQLKNLVFCVKCMISVGVMSAFRSNGLPIVVCTFILLFWFYKRYRKKVILSFLFPIGIALLLGRCLMPEGVEKSFQESVGIPLQQIGAVVAHEEEMTVEQTDYLYRVLPKEDWKQYAPSCADNLKWNEDFDGKYLNETKEKFLRIWLELMPEHLLTYMEAYIMNTYGIWGIETRNSEQYYIKDIWQNELGLYQDSPLPAPIRDFFYRIYCNRFTYRYLSAGTAFWVLLMITLFGLYKGYYRYVIAFSPAWLCFLSLMASTPIAFAFRYVFFMALLFPFLLIMPFLYDTKGMLTRQ